MPVNKEEAIAITKSECKKRGLPWVEPIRTVFRWKAWKVETNCNSGSENARVEINRKTGKVKWIGFTISEAQAIKIAQEECSRRQWEWIEPIKASLYRFRKEWGITVGANILGSGRASIVIDQYTGEVIRTFKQTR